MNVNIYIKFEGKNLIEVNIDDEILTKQDGEDYFDALQSIVKVFRDL